MREIIDEANIEKTLHIIITDESLDDMSTSGLPEDMLINVMNVPFCYKYGLLVFEDVEELELNYYFPRCADTSDLSSGMVAICRSVPELDFDFKKLNIKIHDRKSKGKTR